VAQPPLPLQSVRKRVVTYVDATGLSDRRSRNAEETFVGAIVKTCDQDILCGLLGSGCVVGPLVFFLLRGLTFTMRFGGKYRDNTAACVASFSGVSELEITDDRPTSQTAFVQDLTESGMLTDPPPAKFMRSSALVRAHAVDTMSTQDSR
jgi:hypothetical protein